MIALCEYNREDNEFNVPLLVTTLEDNYVLLPATEKPLREGNSQLKLHKLNKITYHM